MPSDDHVPASSGELVLEPAPVVDGDRMPTDEEVPASTEESTLEPAAVVEKDGMTTDDQADRLMYQLLWVWLKLRTMVPS